MEERLLKEIKVANVTLSEQTIYVFISFDVEILNPRVPIRSTLSLVF